MERTSPEPLLRAVDCVRLAVPDLEAGLAYYRGRLGLSLVWRTTGAAGLRLPGSETEMVLHTEPGPPEVDLLVDSADAAAERIAAAGGTIVTPPFDIAIGRAVVVEDPWGNRLVLLDSSKGLLVTDSAGNVVGVEGRFTTLRTAPLAALQVVAVRYRLGQPAEGDERALDAYAAAGVYRQAGVSVDVVEPALPEGQFRANEAATVGALCGAIAGVVVAARRAGKAVLMTGGDCTHATGVVGGLQEAHGAIARLGLVWFDAHGDFNTPRTTLSGWLGGMPLAVCAGLGLPQWRERARIVAPVPTERIVLVGPRNLDPAEERLLRSTEVTIAAPAAGFPGDDLATSVARLAGHCDLLYLHVDADILDRSLVPSHRTGEPNGPDLAQVQAAIDTVMATGKVAAFALVSVYNQGPGREVSVASGIALIRSALASWRRYGVV